MHYPAAFEEHLQEIELCRGEMDTGDNSGQVANVSFSSIEHLVGGDNNNDTFTVAAGGVFNGLIEGGVGGFDSLVIYGVTHGSYTPGEIFGDGTLLADKSQIQFAGLEPVIEVGTGVGSEYLFNTGTYGVGNDVLTIDSPAAGQNRISGTIGGVSFESFTFSNFATLSIVTGTNDLADLNQDRITFTSPLVATGLQTLSISTGAGDDIVDLAGLPLTNSVTVNIDLGDGNNTLCGTTAGNSWNISGANSGTVDGSVNFENVENLTGAANTKDSFIFGASGLLSGIIAGGAGENDSLFIDAGNFLQIAAAGRSDGIDLLSGCRSAATCM